MIFGTCKLHDTNSQDSIQENNITYIHTYIIRVIVPSHTWNRATVHYKSKYRPHSYVKAMLKRCVFRARRKEGCESISLILTGRLFQISGPQTEKAPRPNWVLVRRTVADLAVVDGAGPTRSKTAPLSSLHLNSGYVGCTGQCWPQPSTTRDT